MQRWHGDPFALLDRFCSEWAPPANGGERGGGVVAALSYDLRHWVERLPRRAPDDLHLPVLYAAAYDWLLSYSYAQRRYRLASSSRSASELRCLAAELAARAASEPLPRPLSETERGGREAFFPLPSQGRGRGVRSLPLVSNFTKDEYVRAVEKSLDYIAAGDVYQVNLAQRLHDRGARRRAHAPAALFAALQRQHPMPFAAYVDAGDFALVSNSPECFLTPAAATGGDVSHQRHARGAAPTRRPTRRSPAGWQRIPRSAPSTS